MSSYEDILMSCNGNPYRDDPVCDDDNNLENEIHTLQLEGNVDDEVLPTVNSSSIVCTCGSGCESGPCCGVEGCILNGSDDVYKFWKRKDVLEGIMANTYVNRDADYIIQPTNRNYRHTFYRIFHLFRIGNWRKALRRCRRKRIPTPGCVIQFIRKEYPELDKQNYVGFKAKRVSTKLFKLSPELAAVVEQIVGEKLSKPEIMKRLKLYIINNNLEQENKGGFIPDRVLSKVFGKSNVKYFGIAKYLTNHIF